MAEVENIQIAVRSVEGLLDAAGSPLAAPRIHPDVAQAIWTDAEKRPRKPALSIEVVVPEADLGRADEVQRAIRSHYERLRLDAVQQLVALNDRGRFSFFYAFLAVCGIILLSELILKLGDARFFSILSESLIIVAWVTLWGPAEALLFSRFPLRRKRALAERLSQATVSLKPQP